jgi:hypothetical protein
MATLTRRNVGPLDRALRVALGVTLVLFSLFCPWAASQGAAVVWGAGLVGAVMLITGVSGSCWLYSLLGVSTRKG